MAQQPQQQQQQQQYTMPMPSQAGSPPPPPPVSSASPNLNTTWGIQSVHKRQRLDGALPTPGSPYATSPSPYNMSPSTPGTPVAGVSPHFSHVAIPAGAYGAPYANGSAAASNPMQHAAAYSHGPSQFAKVEYPAHPHMSTYTPKVNGHNQSAVHQSMPPPPPKPAERIRDEGEPTDALYNTGVDIRQEEELLASTFVPESFLDELVSVRGDRYGPFRSFGHFAPRDSSTEDDEPTAEEQAAYEQRLADQRWYKAAQELAESQCHELHDPFLATYTAHLKIQKKAKDHGIAISDKDLGAWLDPGNDRHRQVTVQTLAGPNGALVSTQGSLLPVESPMVDQIALISLATKQRIRALLEEAWKLATGRQMSSHGVVPQPWTDVVGSVCESSLVQSADIQFGFDSPISPMTNPKKRSATEAGLSEPPKSTIRHEVAGAMRSAASKERYHEEERQRKRQARAAGGDASGRSGSVAPSASGSLASDAGERPLTKKELKNKADRANEAVQHAAANTTTATFLGGLGKKNRFGKQYAWMSGGSSAANGGSSGTSTPLGRGIAAGGGSSNVAAAAAAAGGAAAGEAVAKKVQQFTTEGVRKLGIWREDGLKGRKIQLRDWVTVLENDGVERRALQHAYALLDQSEPK